MIMTSPRRVEMWEKLGTVPLDEAIDLVVKNRTRYGRRVYSQSPERQAAAGVANSQIYQRHLAAIEKQVEKLTQKPPSRLVSTRIVRLQHQREILNAMMKHGDRKLHATELAAALVLTHGLKDVDLRPRFNAAVRLGRLTNPPFEGSFSSVCHALGERGSRNESALEKVHDLLLDRSVPISGNILAGQFDISTRDFARVSGVLDLTGTVHKLPMDSLSKSFMWIHASGTPPEPTWNIDYRVLKLLANANRGLHRQALLAKLISEPHVARVPGSGSLESSLVLRATNRLEQSGLIEIKGKSKFNPRLVARPVAVKWIWRTQKTGKLVPDLRDVLLGEYKQRPPVSERRLQRIIKEMQLRIAREQNLEEKYPTLLKRTGLDIAGQTAWAYLERGNSTLTTTGLPVIRKIADYLERNEHQEEADFIRRHYLNRETEST
ncbi:MAG: hypothetical protein V1722_05050, partial [Candidatus Micrarchaeota archaeon]